MSSDLERSLREAGKALPEPSDAVTRRARERAIAAVRRRRRLRRPAVAVLAAALVVLGVGIGALVAPSGSAAPAPLGLGFLPEPGWTVLQNGGDGTPERPTVAIASSVELSADDDAGGLPLSTLLRLPPNGIVIVTTLMATDDRTSYRTPIRARTLPLRLTDAAPFIEYGVQVRPARPLGQYQVRGTIDGYDVDVHVYFGTKRPAPPLLAVAQRQLDRLVVRADPLPMRSVSTVADTGRIIDRTLLCTTEQSGGVREIEIRANAGFRQGTSWKHLAFAVVATGGTRSAATVLDDSLAWVAAGKYDHDTNLDPSTGLLLTNATRFGTWALDRTDCTPVKAQVPLSGKGLREVDPGVFGVSFDCVTPRRVFVRVRAVGRSATSRYRQGAFEKTRTPLQSGYIAVRTQAGKQLAFASVSETGKARLFTASGCMED